MRILIIEDEPHAAQRMEKLVQELASDAVVLAKLDSVKSTVKWFEQNAPPDLAFMDIQLADGISFQIFEQVDVKCPVIFTTAYDEYALKAFKVNSVDYILKPVDRDELAQALVKFRKLSQPAPVSLSLVESIGEAMRSLSRKYKTRFVIKVGEHLRTIETASVLYFYSQEKTTFCHTQDNRNLIIDYTLEEVCDMVDPDLFFRVNRKYLVSTQAIHDIITYSNSRLKLILKNSADHDIIVAREKVQDFRSWLDR